jgi:hypothetical protein
LTAACKAFGLANGKGMGTNDLVIRNLDYLKKKRRREKLDLWKRSPKTFWGI